MKKIAFIREDFCITCGLERVCTNLANELSNTYDVFIINFYKNKVAYKLNKMIKIVYLHKNRMRFRYSLFVDTFLLRKYLLENKINVIFIMGSTAAIQTNLALIGTNVKVVFCQHNAIESDLLNAKSLKGKIYRACINKLLQYLTDKIVVLTEKDLYKYFLKKLKIKHKKLINIYNFVDDKLVNKTKKYNQYSQKIITVGRIDFAKGYEYLIVVAKLVFAKYPNWQWHIYGDSQTEYKDKIIDLIKQNNLQNHIILMGNHSDIYDLYQDYSFYVMTSRYEGLPMVLLEAKAKKLPIVSFDINSGPSDIIRDGIDGFLINPFDCQKMADKICELIENPELRQKFSDNAHGNIDKFSKEKIIKQWCDLIDSLS